MKSHNPLNEDEKKTQSATSVGKKHICANNTSKQCARQSRHGDKTWTAAVLGKSGRGREVTVQLGAWTR